MEMGWGTLANLARVRDYKSRRLSSWDRSGGNFDAILVPAGERVAFGDITGAGCVRHIWVTMTSLPSEPHELRQTVLRIFWDGESSPSVEVPLGDFFGIGFGLRRNFVSLPLQMSPQDGKGMNCWFPMPFAQGARFELANQGSHQRLFYFYIDYEEHRAIDSDLGRFHAWWNRVNPTAGTAREHGYTRKDYGLDESRPVGAGVALGGPWLQPNLTGERNYVILDVQGSGHYVGCNLNIDVFERQVNDWYGEGDDMIFIDGEPWPPRLHGTGTEDYFNTAFCPTQEYCAPYHGITVYSGNPAWPWGGRNSLYRFHIEDPIRFERSIRVTIEAGHNNELANDYSSTAYWYEIGRTHPLRALPPVEERIPGPDPPELRPRT
jgi:D-arabinan exo alpha-(1,3)/(1,5)-arabinofuranosidase (non-reducing end)